MNEAPAKNPILDRQIRSFQFKIQQQLTLHDEEIQRLADRLNITKSRIIESREKINELDKEIEGALHSKEAAAKMQQASFNTQFARQKASFNTSIQNLQNQQLAEITQLHNEFEEKLKSIPSTGRGASHENLIRTLREIENVKTKIQTFRSQTTKIKQETDMIQNEENNDIGIDFSPIQNLQETIQRRQQERIDNLNQARDKLRQCVSALEKMVEDHDSDVSKIRSKLDGIDEEYQKKIDRLNQKHALKVELLQTHLNEAEKRARALMRAARHLGLTNHKQLRETVFDLDKMKQKTLEQADDIAIRSEDKEQYNDMKKEVFELKRRMNEKENQLEFLKKENQQLKREYGKLRHELRFSNSPVKVFD